MAFNPPTYNLAVSIWRNGNPNYLAPDVSVMGNLAFGRRDSYPLIQLTSQMSLLLPSLTDVRGRWNGNNADYVEVPSGSHRFYTVQSVDDSGKGFGNEHRIAGIEQLTSGLFGFPFPVPLP